MKDKFPPNEEGENVPASFDDPKAEAVETDELSENDLESVSGGGDSGDSSWKPF